MSQQINWINIKSYFQGNIRMWFYYSKRLNFLLPLHIYEQIAYRLFKMRKECFTNGACLECGCATPALQMADKSCAGNCYPAMMDEKEWNNHKKYNSIEFRYWNKEKPRQFELRISHKSSRV